MSPYFIYILECSNGAYYTGYTTDMERRYQEHLDGSDKCKYTRSFPPLRIAACWELPVDLSMVLKIEHAIKSLSKEDKKHLVSKPERFRDVLLSRGIIFPAHPVFGK